jgi:hypothetical protein
MTHDDLTDFYAGLALLGLLSSGKLEPEATEKHIAKQSFSLADAMMEERKRRDYEERTSC